MASQSANASDSAGSMSFVYYLSSVIPKSLKSDSLFRHLYCHFVTDYLAVIPSKLGRMQHLSNHAEEYESLLGYKLEVQSKSILPAIGPTVRAGVKFNYYNHHKIHYRSPGVIRVIPRGSAQSRRVKSPVLSISSLNLQKNSKYLAISPLKRTAARTKRNSDGTPSQADRRGYTGETKNGNRHGFGTACYPNGDSYKGHWTDDFRNGSGTYNYASIGLKYKGDWYQNKRQGEGKLVFRNGDKLSGFWENGRISEHRASLFYKNGSLYEGEILNCLPHNTGCLTYPGGEMYKGEWSKSLREGLGFIKGDSFFFEGYFQKDSSQGVGVLVHRGAIHSSKDLIPDFSMHESFINLSHFEQFSSMDLSSYDIVYMSVTSKQLKQVVEAPTNLKFKDGIFSAGKLNGLGIAKYGSFGLYIGNFQDGKRSGWGQMTYTDPNYVCTWTYETEGVYTGQWLDDKRQGLGVMIWPSNMKYQGNYNKDRRHQVSGKIWLVSGEVYEGGWVGDYFEGLGKLTTVNGVVFKGQFAGGKAENKGTLEFTDGKIYKGEVSMFEPHGKGKMKYTNNDVYNGHFERGYFNGFGVLRKADGEVYNGEWESGLKHGNGVIYTDQYIYDGEWVSNKRDGFGVLKNKDGSVIYKGNWMNDSRDTRNFEE